MAWLEKQLAPQSLLVKYILSKPFIAEVLSPNMVILWEWSCRLNCLKKKSRPAAIPVSTPSPTKITLVQRQLTGTKEAVNVFLG